MAEIYAFTESQKVLIREYTGYNPLRVDGGSVAFGFLSQADAQLEYLFGVLSVVEGERVTTLLETCERLEMAILTAADNLEDSKVAIIEANPKEVAQRDKIFQAWRIKLCNAMGCHPGPNLRRGGSLRLIA